MMLQSSFSNGLIEAGIDEAGRGCLAGPVFAAAVILPVNYNNELLDDSKKLSEGKRSYLRQIIEKEAIAFAVAKINNDVIDEINILNATYLSMNKAITELSVKPELLLIDGNRFSNTTGIEYKCIIKGDQKYQSIGAASILAKTYRDEYMKKIHSEYSIYNWNKNKGYPTLEHKRTILQHGLSQYHRKSFNSTIQLKIFN